MTQMSASRASRICPAVLNISAAKLEVWFDISIVEKAVPKIRPRYFTRSPSRIRSATPFIRASKGRLGEERRDAASRPGDRASFGLAAQGSATHNVYGVI